MYFAECVHRRGNGERFCASAEPKGNVGFFGKPVSITTIELYGLLLFVIFQASRYDALRLSLQRTELPYLLIYVLLLTGPDSKKLSFFCPPALLLDLCTNKCTSMLFYGRKKCQKALLDSIYDMYQNSSDILTLSSADRQLYRFGTYRPRRLR